MGNEQNSQDGISNIGMSRDQILILFWSFFIFDLFVLVLNLFGSLSSGITISLIVVTNVGIILVYAILYGLIKSESMHTPIIRMRSSSKSKFRPGEIAEKYISEVDIWVRICCYQTARLGEKYCECGRLIDENLILYLKSE